MWSILAILWNSAIYIWMEFSNRMFSPYARIHSYTLISYASEFDQLHLVKIQDKDTYIRHEIVYTEVLYRLPFDIKKAYRQVSYIKSTKSPHLNDSRTALRLSLPSPLKPDVKSRMKM